MKQAAAAAPELLISSAEVSGSAAGALVEASRSADSVVVGARGLGQIRSTVTGSVSQQVAMHGHCPVVVVRGEPGDERGRVVVGVDVSRPSSALDVAFEAAATRHAELVALHSWWWEPMAGVMYDSPWEGEWEQLAEQESRLLTEALAGFRADYPQVPVHEKVIRSLPGEALVSASDDADLLVVGTRGRGGFVGLLLGSVSLALLHHARCPIAIVPDRRE